MNEQATQGALRPKQTKQQGAEPQAPPRPSPATLASLPDGHLEPHEYLQSRGWKALGYPKTNDCLWLQPDFRVVETQETVEEPMTNEVERYERGKRLLAEGEIASNPLPRTRTQVRVTPASVPVNTATAYRQQLLADMREREAQVRAEARQAVAG